ncbi:PREDICTED: complement factor H, partial [Pygoscelis adeliae]|uniref:complement factor H n=1 Tax=Pygoscelis adeliae TaxID=9238 RepID=UPI0004F4EA55
MSFLGYTALLLCWMYCTAERACKEPPPRRVKEVPTERWDKPPYPHGTQVTYRCRPGYIKLGRIVFECADGAWKQHLPGAECRSKPCGHPGDTEFGSFELTSGSEFVFGARVEYRCNDGYRMLSQRNYRECQADGWSNDIPHCEVAKCLPVQAPENGRIIMTGAFELGREYSFGQVVNFECNAKYRLVGSKEIICSSNGKWNSDVPQCQEIICDVPKILHGYVRSPKGSYKESEQLQFGCDEGYRYGERADVQCTESGWNPTPHCTAIMSRIVYHIDLKLTNPKNHGHELLVYTNCICLYYQRHFIQRAIGFPTANTLADEKPCDYPTIENGKLSEYMENYKSYYFPMRFGQQIDYSCNNGYSTPSGESWVPMVCSERGWSPEPKCLKKCHVGRVENGYFSRSWKRVYTEGEKVKYGCYDGYHSEREDGEVTCTKDDWSPPPRCIRKKKCMNTPFDNGRFALGKNAFYLQEKVTYGCDTGFVTPEGQETGVIQCQENGWTPPPKCIKDKMPCGSPSSIPNVILHQEDQMQFSHGDEVICGCKQGSGNSEEMKIKCLNGEWKPLPLCADPSPQCVIPRDVERVHSSRFSKAKKRTGFHGVIHYICKSADKSIKQATCVSGKWSPEIECTAEESTCPPPPQVPGAQQITVGRNYKNGSKIAFSCLKGFQLIGVNEITCMDGKWQSPPHCVERPCLPPQPVECADVPRLENQNLKIRKEGKTIYLAGARFKYVSRSGYTLDGPSEITCSLGKWTSSPTCLEMPCGSIPKVANAQIEGRNKEMYEPGETIRYQCDAGFLIVGPPEIICRAGNWTAPPFCEDVSCGAAPEIPNAYITSTRQERYLPGARVQYECESNFQMMGGNYVTCRNREWSQAPICRDVTCEPPPEIAGGKVQGVKKSRYLPGESAHYQCWQGFQMTGTSTVACQNGTWTELPKCKGKGGKCGPPPVIENGDLLSFPMQEYPQGTTLEYKCPSLYVLEGSQYITCTGGQWTSPPVCLDPEGITCAAALVLGLRCRQGRTTTCPSSVQKEFLPEVCFCSPLCCLLSLATTAGLGGGEFGWTPLCEGIAITVQGSRVGDAAT